MEASGEVSGPREYQESLPAIPPPSQALDCLYPSRPLTSM